MQIHRTAHASGFTVLSNSLLQDRRLTYTARGLIADLLSRPDDWREDGRHMADSSPQGRGAVSRALRELAALGYYRVDRTRRPDGTVVSEAHVWDTPQHTAPDLTRPGSGGPDTGDCGTQPVKNRKKEPSLPAPQSDRRPPRRRSGSDGDARPSRAGGQDAPRPADLATAATAEATEAVAVLFRVLRPEPRLRIGTVEALQLAPLVAAWLERGCTPADLAHALLPGLPARLHSAAALLRDRLVRKLPPTPRVAAVPAVARFECGICGDPVPRAGICRPCAGLGTPVVAVGGGEAFTARGAAMVRAAMRPAVGRPSVATR